MNSVLDQYDGARRPAQPRVLHYRTTFSNGEAAKMPFTEVQTNAFGTVLEPDGVPLMAAIRMVEQWNRQAVRQGNGLRYSIPFVKPARDISS